MSVIFFQLLVKPDWLKGLKGLKGLEWLLIADFCGSVSVSDLTKLNLFSGREPVKT